MSDIQSSMGARVAAAVAAEAVAPTPVPADPPVSPKSLGWAALLLFLALIVCMAGYLALSIPNSWFPGASPKSFSAQQLTIARGTGQLIDGELVVTAPDAAGLTLISLVSDLRSSDYPAIAWNAIDLPEHATVRLLWRTDYAPAKLNEVTLNVDAGRLLPAVVAKNPAWVGRVTGLALAIQGPLVQPIRIRGVVAKPMGAVGMLADRASEWFAFEAWNGASINTLSGGADGQEFPLPVLVGLAVAIATAAVYFMERWRPGTFGMPVPVTAGALFLLAWLLLDARWMGNLIRQERQTANQYAGKDTRQKHLVSEDAQLFAFVERARQVLPSSPVRIFIAADADYFRGRAAYHLYPHSVFFDPRSNEVALWAGQMRPGDWLLVYHRPGIQYDPARQMLRWDGGGTAPAELKLLESGAALFRML